jgi:hypothetical protein
MILNYISIYFIVAILLNIISSHPLNILPNSEWKINHETLKFNDSSENDRIFGLIRWLIQKEQRNVYFSLDTTWMDKLLFPESNVHISYIKPNDIKNKIMPQPR